MRHKIAFQLAFSSGYNDCRNIAKRKTRYSVRVFQYKKRDEFSTTCHLEKDRKYIQLTSYADTTESKDKKNIAVLSKSRPLHGETIDDKEQPQIYNFYDFYNHKFYDRTKKLALWIS